MKCRYKSTGHTFLWVQWKLRYDQASPRDLLRAKEASPGLKFVSPGRRTCELDRPGGPEAHIKNFHCEIWAKSTILEFFNTALNATKNIRRDIEKRQISPFRRQLWCWKILTWPSWDLGEMHCWGANLFWHGCNETQLLDPHIID